MEKKNSLRTVRIVGVVVFNVICAVSVIYVLTMGVERRQAIGADTQVQVIKDFEAAKTQPNPKEVKSAEANLPDKAVQQPAQQSVKKVEPVQSVAGMFLVDDFTGFDEIKNRIGSRANVYTRAPSRVMISKRDDTINGVPKKVLMIKYDKKNTGGPNGMGGWCGYYTLIKNEKTGEYLDGTGYKYITLWVKGDKGEENFMVGCADEHWDKIGDSLKAEEIGAYLDKGKITAQWQKAKVPLDAFFLDHAKLSAISINFEADCFPEGAGAGVVYISDIALEK
jgi:hypothetical protein